MFVFLALSSLLLARFSASSSDVEISQQNAMESFAKEIVGNKQIANEQGVFRPVDEWDGVRVSHGSVIRIRWNKKGLSGPFAFSQLPDSLSTIVISENDFTGSIASLPADLEFLSCEENRFSGSIEWEYLPVGLIFLDVRQNGLTGDIDLLSVSKSIESIYIRNNNIRVMNRNASGAWRGSGDVTNLNRKSMTPHVKKTKPFDVKPVSESVPAVSDKNSFSYTEPEEASLKSEKEVFDPLVAHSPNSASKKAVLNDAPEKSKPQAPWTKIIMFGLFWAVILVFASTYSIF